jgi:hypothetical protein
VTRCTYRKPNGSRCRANARPGRTFCTFHDPDLAAERAEGRRQGGVNRCQKMATLPADTPDLSLQTVDDVVKLLGATVNQVRTGKIAVPVANSVGILAGTLLKALETSDLDKRLQVLEAKQPSRNGRRIQR